MRKVIMIGEEPKEESKGIEFTHCLMIDKGWKKTSSKASQFNKIVYLGKCAVDGDMFACYFKKEDTIAIYKGKLKNGTY
jgi:hypothetical protein